MRCLLDANRFRESRNEDGMGQPPRRLNRTKGVHLGWGNETENQTKQATK